MCLVVSGVSFLIHVYSISYMSGDHGFDRFFAYLNYFVFSMLLLVLAGNFILLIVGWAFVGAASYLLISFWYRRTTATYAGIKAFVMNVIGDVGLVIAAFLILNETGQLEYLAVFERAPEVFAQNDVTIVAACLLLLVGAFAKSAQLPLHTWLPDAMEGPTPVSALIHAATMVTAGVYLIARTFPLFQLAPTAADIGAIIGTATLVFAATVALVQTDLKRVIAYSTMSQIGYMVLGVSVAAYSAGLFHLMTHAFFKALLFMGAGSVIGAMAGIQDMDRMGGFRKAMPFTFVTFTIGALALAAFPFTSGFFSKDEVLAYTINRGGGFVVLAIAGYFGAALTGFYAFRMVFRVFGGEPVPEARELEGGHAAHGEPMNPLTGEPEDTDVGFPGPEHNVAESSLPMKFAMAPLAFLALVAGVVGIPGLTDTLEHFLEPTFEDSRYVDDHPSAGAEWVGLAAGGIISVASIYVAYVFFVRRRGITLELRDRYSRLHAFLFHKWYFDELLRRRVRAADGHRRGVRATRGRDRLRAGLHRGRHHGDRPGGHLVRARDPDRLPARLRPAAAARRGRAHPLLPDRELMTIHLSIVLFLPLATGLLGAVLPRGMARWAVLAGTVAVLAYAIAMLADFDSSGGLQYVTDDEWIEELGIGYQLGVDGLNLFMVLLTAIAWVPCTLWAAVREHERPKLFFFHIGLAETAVLGAFMAQDLALFIVFFDLMLVPFYFLIGGWGTGDRVRATTKFVIYTLSGSLLMLAAAIALGVLATPDGGELSFSLAELERRSVPEGTQHWIVLLFALAFFVKAPLFPLHGWVPETYRSTPIPVLALLSGVLSKVGVYGFLRIVLPVMPEGSQHWQELFIVIAVFSILYGSVLAFSQDNVRLVVAYSSIAQLGFIVLGIFALDDKGAQGAVLQMLNHGLVVVPLFLIIGVVAARSNGGESLAQLGGMAFRAPVLAALFLITTFATLAMPGQRQLHRRGARAVRIVRGQARVRPRGERRRGARGGVHDPALPARDARPGRPGGALA